jgi:hypothetical protein
MRPKDAIPVLLARLTDLVVEAGAVVPCVFDALPDARVYNGPKVGTLLVQQDDGPDVVRDVVAPDPLVTCYELAHKIGHARAKADVGDAALAAVEKIDTAGILAARLLEEQCANRLGRAELELLGVDVAGFQAYAAEGLAGYRAFLATQGVKRCPRNAAQ